MDDGSVAEAWPRFRELAAVDVHGLHHPADEREVAALIRFARARALTVRVRGSGHSVPAAIHASARLRGDDPRSDAVELSLDRLTAIDLDATSGRVTVGGGCRLGPDPRDPQGPEGLCAHLDRHGWALANLGGVSHQTVAGYFATGSAGGSLQHDLSAQVLAFRLVDGRGQVQVIERADPRFDAVGVSLGLCGVITAVTLQCEPRYDVEGDEAVTPAITPTFDAFADGERGVAGLLEREPYARLLWWPQRDVGRFAVWRARRTAPGSPPVVPRPYAPMTPVLGSQRVAQLAAGAALGVLGGWRSTLTRALGPTVVALADQVGARRAESALVRSFVPLGPPRPFGDSWHRALPMDDAISDALLPTSFTELWLPLEHTGEALRRLRALYAGDPGAAGHFATELYAAPRSRSWLSPSNPGPALRINAFWYDRNPGDPRRDVFPRLWSTFADLGYRLHWGKALPLDAAASARYLAQQYPRWGDFQRVRAQLDPEGVFLSDYWRAHLGIDAAQAGVPAPPAGPARPEVGPLRRDTFWRETEPQHRQWPMLFELLPADARLIETADRSFTATAFVPATPEQVSCLATDIARSGTWFPSFVHQESRTPVQGAGSVYDETFAFMTIRMRVLDQRAGQHWIAAVDACSLPLARRMIMTVRFEPEGAGTRVRWIVSYETRKLTRSLDPVLAPAFQALFQRGLDNLARHFAAGGR